MRVNVTLLWGNRCRQRWLDNGQVNVKVADDYGSAVTAFASARLRQRASLTCTRKK